MGASLMALPMNSLALQSLHGQIHRFTGVIDRLGGFPQSGRIIQTLCVRELRLASTDQPVTPDHWWFRLREDWAQTGIEPGDTVLFTAKVQRCTKGWDQPIAPDGGPRRRRQQVVGLGGRIRDVVVTQRVQRHSVVVSGLQEQVRSQALLLAEAEADLERRLAGGVPGSAAADQVPIRWDAGGRGLPRGLRAGATAAPAVRLTAEACAAQGMSRETLRQPQRRGPLQWHLENVEATITGWSRKHLRL